MSNNHPPPSIFHPPLPLPPPPPHQPFPVVVNTSKNETYIPFPNHDLNSPLLPFPPQYCPLTLAPKLPPGTTNILPRPFETVSNIAQTDLDPSILHTIYQYNIIIRPPIASNMRRAVMIYNLLHLTDDLKFLAYDGIDRGYSLYCLPARRYRLSDFHLTVKELVEQYDPSQPTNNNEQYDPSQPTNNNEQYDLSQPTNNNEEYRIPHQSANNNQEYGIPHQPTNNNQEYGIPHRPRNNNNKTRSQLIKCSNPELESIFPFNTIVTITPSSMFNVAEYHRRYTTASRDAMNLTRGIESMDEDNGTNNMNANHAINSNNHDDNNITRINNNNHDDNNSIHINSNDSNDNNANVATSSDTINTETNNTTLSLSTPTQEIHKTMLGTFTNSSLINSSSTNSPHQFNMKTIVDSVHSLALTTALDHLLNHFLTVSALTDTLQTQQRYDVAAHVDYLDKDGNIINTILRNNNNTNNTRKTNITNDNNTILFTSPDLLSQPVTTALGHQVLVDLPMAVFRSTWFNFKFFHYLADGLYGLNGVFSSLRFLESGVGINVDVGLLPVWRAGESIKHVLEQIAGIAPGNPFHYHSNEASVMQKIENQKNNQDKNNVNQNNSQKEKGEKNNDNDDDNDLYGNTNGRQRDRNYDNNTKRGYNNISNTNRRYGESSRDLASSPQTIYKRVLNLKCWTTHLEKNIKVILTHVSSLRVGKISSKTTSKYFKSLGNGDNGDKNEYNNNNNNNNGERNDYNNNNGERNDANCDNHDSITLDKYFEFHYNLPINPHLYAFECKIVSSATVITLPVEVLRLIGGQFFSGEINSNVRTQILASTCDLAPIRLQAALKQLNSLRQSLEQLKIDGPAARREQEQRYEAWMRRKRIGHGLALQQASLGPGKQDGLLLQSLQGNQDGLLLHSGHEENVTSLGFPQSPTTTVSKGVVEAVATSSQSTVKTITTSSGVVQSAPHNANVIKKNGFSDKISVIERNRWLENYPFQVPFIEPEPLLTYNNNNNNNPSFPYIPITPLSSNPSRLFDSIKGLPCLAVEPAQSPRLYNDGNNGENDHFENGEENFEKTQKSTPNDQNRDQNHDPNEPSQLNGLTINNWLHPTARVLPAPIVIYKRRPDNHTAPITCYREYQGLTEILLRPFCGNYHPPENFFFYRSANFSVPMGVESIQDPNRIGKDAGMGMVGSSNDNDAISTNNNVAISTNNNDTNVSQSSLPLSLLTPPPSLPSPPPPLPPQFKHQPTAPSNTFNQMPITNHYTKIDVVLFAPTSESVKSIPHGPKAVLDNSKSFLSESQLDKYVKAVIFECWHHGLVMNPPNPAQNYQGDYSDESIRQWILKLGSISQLITQQLQLLARQDPSSNLPRRHQFLILATLQPNSQYYHVLKRVGETEAAIPSQCCDSTKVGKFVMHDNKLKDYIGHLILKINAKLGGLNWSLAQTELFNPLLHHPPGNDEGDGNHKDGNGDNNNNPIQCTIGAFKIPPISPLLRVDGTFLRAPGDLPVDFHCMNIGHNVTNLNQLNQPVHQSPYSQQDTNHTQTHYSQHNQAKNNSIRRPMDHYTNRDGNNNNRDNNNNNGSNNYHRSRDRNNNDNYYSHRDRDSRDNNNYSNRDRRDQYSNGNGRDATDNRDNRDNRDVNNKGNSSSHRDYSNNSSRNNYSRDNSSSRNSNNYSNNSYRSYNNNNSSNNNNNNYSSNNNNSSHNNNNSKHPLSRDTSNNNHYGPLPPPPDLPNTISSSLSLSRSSLLFETTSPPTTTTTSITLPQQSSLPSLPTSQQSLPLQIIPPTSLLPQIHSIPQTIPQITPPMTLLPKAPIDRWFPPTYSNPRPTPESYLPPPTTPKWINRYWLGRGHTLGDESHIARTMVVGIDVCHDGSNRSHCAVVASWNAACTAYNSICFQQSARQEILSNENARDAFRILLIAFAQKNRGNLPNHIILYRDGVSDSQLGRTLENELAALISATQTLGLLSNQTQYNVELGRKSSLYCPTISYLIAVKRHNVRFHPTDLNITDAIQVNSLNESANSLDNGNSVMVHYKQTRNCPAGTIIDHSIVRADLSEFFLQSHTGVIGTARPTLYQVCYLSNPNKITLDQLQLFTHYLCYAHQRTPTSTSLPIPVFYAHLLSYRARKYNPQLNPFKRVSKLQQTAMRAQFVERAERGDERAVEGGAWSFVEFPPNMIDKAFFL